MSGKPQVAIEITGHAAGAQKALKGVEGDLAGFRGKVRSQFSQLGTELGDLLNSRLTQALSLGALAAGLRYAFQASDNLEASNRKLAATAALTDQNLGFLQKTAADANAAFQLGARNSNEFTIALAKLGTKAGEVDETGAAIGALLDLAAARGYTAGDALSAINQAILGIDEGTDKLFGKNPSVIYAEWAEKTGVLAGKMDDSQKAQALLDAILTDGGKVRGQYAEWLESAAGKQYALQIQTENAASAIGRSLEGVRMATLPFLAELAQGLVAFVGGIQLMGAALPVHLGEVKLYLAELDEAWGGTLTGIADRLTSFADWLQKQPMWLRIWFGIGNLAGPAGNFVGDAVAGGVEGAKAELARLREAYEAEAKKIVADLNNMTAVVGSTNPFQPPRPPPKGEDLSKADQNKLDRLARDFDPWGFGARYMGIPKGGKSAMDLEKVPVPKVPPQQISEMQKFAHALNEALGSGNDLSRLLSDMTFNTLSAFGDAVTDAFAAFVSGSESAGEAFKNAMLQGVAAVAKGLGDFYTGKAVAAIAEGIATHDPSQWVAAAKFMAAATAMYAIAGGSSGVTSRGGGGGGGAGSSAVEERQQVASQAKGEAVIVLDGSWRAILSDPDAQDSFANLLEDLTDRRVVVTAR